jgi:two-component system OmpR family sensor kinase
MSLRALLGAAAFAALLTAIALCALLLITAGSARGLVDAVRGTHNYVQLYTQLESAAREYLASSYVVARVRTDQTLEAVENARRRYIEALDAVLNLPIDSPRRRAVIETLRMQGEHVRDHLARSEQIVAEIDHVWRTQGSVAAMIVAERSAEPTRVLERTLREEIRRGEEEIGAAMARAMGINRTVVIACVICLLLAVGCWAIVHGLLLKRLRPGLRRLEQGALAFASGDLSHRVNLGGHDELSRLSSAFDSMAQLLAEKQAALQDVQLSLERAVRARTEELERANKELSAADERRRAFLADIGHELRTPLTIIRGEAQVALRLADQPDFNALEVFERILKLTLDLSRMVEDLFLIARAEAGGLPMQLEETDLRALASRVAGDFSSLVAGSRASITVVPGPPVYAMVDPDRVRRAVAALIDNALRHTHDGVRVVIDATQTEQGATLQISDDGPGIDPALMPDLFKRFRRGATRAEGSGLGLALVRALVEAQRGRARLENRAEGGAMATLEFSRFTSSNAHPHHEFAVDRR